MTSLALYKTQLIIQGCGVKSKIENSTLPLHLSCLQLALSPYPDVGRGVILMLMITRITRQRVYTDDIFS